MTTLKERMAATGGRASGFDYIRLVLAVSIIAFHSVTVSYGQEAQTHLLMSPWAVPFQFVVPMFFALSGFLVAGSYERCQTLISFLGLRVLRIGPALAVEVLLSALLLGPFFTTLPISAYAASPTFLSYFLNIVGDIHYQLPGVFQHNPTTPVNGQLWTVPFELECYLALAALAIIGLVRRRWLLLTLCICLQGFLAVHAVRRSAVYAPSLSGEMLVFCFFSGLLLYRYRDRVPWSGTVAAGFTILAALLLAVPNGKYFVVPAIAYLTVYLGLLNPRKSRLLLGGDYSYGLYLFGYPIQQAIVAALGRGSWEFNLIVSLPCAIIFAFCSWHLVEKHALRLKPKLIALERAILSRVNSIGRIGAMGNTIEQET